MKIVRFKNDSFGVRRWNWSGFEFQLLGRRSGQWESVKNAAKYHDAFEMTYDEANEWIDIIDAVAKRNKLVIDRGTPVSRKNDRPMKGPSF